MFFKGEVLILIIIGAFDVKRGGFDTCSKRGGFDTSKKYQNFQKNIVDNIKYMVYN